MPAHSTTILALAATAAIASAQTTYQLTDMGTLGGQANANAINNAGAVAGFASLPSNNAFRATRWNGTLHNLGTVVGFNQTVATAVSEAGAVYGVGLVLADPDMHTLRFDDAGAVDLGAFAARSVNSAGDLVGLNNFAIAGYLYPRPCLFRAGMVTNLTLLTGALTFPRPVLWTSAAAAPIDLGTLAGTTTAGGQAMAINAGGTIAGWSRIAGGNAHATLWRTNTAGAVTQRLDLGALTATTTSFANALNNADTVVGTSDFRAFIWTAGTMTDLNTLTAIHNPDWKLEVATGINDAGWIVGTGTYQGWPRAFLLKPVVACGPADFGSQGGIAGPDGLLDNNDFIAFIDAFFAASPRADLGVQGGIPGADGLFDNNDFVVFIDLFFAGCP
jgi:uncharacterized membrane protein